VVFLDGEKLLAGGEDGALHIRNARTGVEILSFDEEPRSPVTSLAVSPDRRVVYAGYRNARLSVRGVDTGRLVGAIPCHDHQIVELSADATAVLGLTSEKIYRWEMGDQEVHFRPTRSSRSVACASKGRCFVGTAGKLYLMAIDGEPLVLVDG